ncbi:MAG: DUF4238 domain-containing protein [Bacteroidota bacterium]
MKKQQHYVWKNYLKPWSIQGKICCLREGKTFATSLKNIGQQRYFYKAEKLTDNEQDFLKGFIEYSSGENKASLYRLLKLYNNFSNGNEYAVNCGIEDIHSIIESRSIELLNNLYKDDFSFFQDPKLRNTFSFFVSAQYTRTNRMRENVSRERFQTPNLNNERLARVFHLFFIDITSNWIYNRTKIQLIINDTSKDLITGDQPVINIKNNPRSLNEPEGFDLFYPISPKKAILLSEEAEGIKYIKKDDVEQFNNLIFEHSEEQVYSKKMSDLKSFK